MGPGWVGNRHYSLHCHNTATLFCTTLDHIAPHYTRPHCSLIHWTTLFFTALDHTAVHYTRPDCSALQWNQTSAKHWSTLFRTALAQTVLHYTEAYGSALHTIVWPQQIGRLWCLSRNSNGTPRPQPLQNSLIHPNQKNIVHNKIAVITEVEMQHFSIDLKCPWCAEVRPRPPKLSNKKFS